MPEELWMEVCNTVQETVIKTIPMEKKCKKAKWLSGELYKYLWKEERLDLSTTALISHASKVMLKILQVRLQQYVNRELPGVEAGFRKGRGTRDQIANIRWII